MSWSFRRRVKIIPGVHLNLSKSGISTTIGIKGANINFGSKGVYLNTGIPGTGIYNRQKILNDKTYPEPQPHHFQYIQSLPDNIFSASLQEITSQNMQGIKEAILSAHEERKSLSKDIVKVKTTLIFSKIKLILSYVALVAFIKKSVVNSLKLDITSQKETLNGLRKCFENCFVNIVVDFDQEIEEKYNKTLDSFKKLITSQKIWDVTSAHSHDRVHARSAASTIIKKHEVKFGIKNLPDIKTDLEIFYFKNANGADLYFYPNFIVMHEDKKNFAIIGLDELEFNFSPTRFVEDGNIPGDSKIIGYTWAKVNKNGSPDKRFKGNYKIPIVRYGTIALSTNTGLNEEYEFSNYECCEEFSHNFIEYKMALERLQKT